MADTLSKARRSENMRRIRSAMTGPEVIVGNLIRRMDVRFQTNVRTLPGKPDFVRKRHKQAVFLHGCFWHQHPKEDCLDARLPKSNTEYWRPKLERTMQRDHEALRLLKRAGWRVLVIWECELRNGLGVTRRLKRFFRLKSKALK